MRKALSIACVTTRNGYPRVFLQKENELIQARRDNGIETSGRLVKRQDVRIQRDSSCNGRSFPHASRKLVRIKLRGVLKTYHPKLDPCHQLYRGSGKFCEFL